MLASLTALQELGLIEEQDGRWLPVPVTAKQDLASAPVLQKRLATMAGIKRGFIGMDARIRPAGDNGESVDPASTKSCAIL